MPAVADRRQRTNSLFLALNTGTNAAAGLAFWFLLARIAHLDPALLGVGYATVALATTVAILAKGGIDTALLRTVPLAGRREGRLLLALAAAMGGAIALLVSAVLGFGVAQAPGMASVEWTAVAGLALLLACTWFQDAYFLALGDARLTFARNLVMAVVRLGVALPLVWITATHSVPAAWLIGLTASALAGVALDRWARPA